MANKTKRLWIRLSPEEDALFKQKASNYNNVSAMIRDAVRQFNDIGTVRKIEALNDMAALYKKYQQDLTKKQREVEALNREIERIIREALEGKDGKKGKTESKPAKPVDYTLAKKFESNKGKLPWPAEGPIVDHFGQRYHPVYTNLKLPFNNGISIAMTPGAKVSAVFEGEVKQIVVMPGYNKCILVQHGNYFSFYCKMGWVTVKAGDKVKTGQVLGTVETIGGETQLHFQIWSGRTPQNPETWLRPR